MKQYLKCFSILLFIILLDQVSKLWVYHNMEMGPGGQIHILGNFLKLTYTLNPGMAFGIQIGLKYGKLFLSILRILASTGIAWYIIRFLKKHGPTIYIWGWVSVLAGAIGNSIDSIFYGVCLGNTPSDAPINWFYGQVIDMIHVDIWSGVMPNWMPIWGGYEVYCLPVFNIADVAIFIGLLIVMRSFHPITIVEEDQAKS
ncbi:lipoprotein signal peptidase [Cardinium endosymbiont of Culicoides punctatus]|uniref:lipoprotein signal peptidase n=1 Tax=Cardinium endosymbiont of Culicoides punctatus TaxID=2304601 RepID=UPI00105902A1|nr:lipoprotein signal peptidase [Cardinium endosymbiont of Culicoides punctatus]TDG93279.1 Lipoprotein signal peptidase [Cardinium endosymbiont of Culicoides punctatus]